MFNEKNIPKLIIISPIIAIFLITFFTSYLFITTQYKNFDEKSLKIEREFFESKKALLKEEITRVYNYLDNQESLYTSNANEKVIKRTYVLSSRLNRLYQDLNKDEKILKNIINQKTSETNYFFAYDIKNKQIIQPKNKDINKEFYEDEKFFENYLYSEEGKLIPFTKSNKVVFIKYLPKVDWIIGNIEDISKDINFIKEVSKKYIDSLKFDDTGFIWAYETNKDTFLDEKSTIKEYLEQIKDSDEGEHLSYNESLTNIEKLAFIRHFERWDWYIGASLNTYEIYTSIRDEKKELSREVEKYVSSIIYISLGVMIVITVLFIMISSKVSETFKQYQKNEEKQKKQLKELNNSLEKKVDEAVKDVQYKERAMLHQSRLARLGTMLSMIAHQWRQPLSEVSSIIMELETATQFNKVDKNLILDCTNDADRLLSYMSDTIDDFRTFFKPDKKKEDFSVKDACNKCIGLICSTYDAMGIKLTKDYHDDYIACGYPREFSQVILNLLLNAKDIFEERKVKNPQVFLELKKEKDNIILTVKDNAGGINLENIDIIFEPYFSTKQSSKASGMGLYMSKMIIENNMNGKLEVCNINDGAEFKITI